MKNSDDIRCLQINVFIGKQNGRFVAYSPEIEVSASGRTLKEVQKEFAETVDVWRKTVLKAGILDEVLTELGWKRVHGCIVQSTEFKEIPPHMTYHGMQDLRIPAAAL